MNTAQEIEKNYEGIAIMAGAWGIRNDEAIADVQQDYALGYCQAVSEGHDNPHKAGINYADKMCRRATRHNKQTKSIDVANPTTGKTTADTMADTAAPMATNDGAVWINVDRLREVEKNIINAIYRDGKDNTTIAAECGCSTSYVARIHHEALANLKAVA